MDARRGTRAGQGGARRRRRRAGRPRLASRRRARLPRHARRQPRQLRGDGRAPCRQPERGRSVTSSRLELELREQPDALARLLERQAANARDLGALFNRDDVRYVLIASRGSSSNAARYAQYLLGRASRVPVAFATPSLYTLYGQPPSLRG